MDSGGETKQPRDEGLRDETLESRSFCARVLTDDWSWQQWLLVASTMKPAAENMLTGVGDVALADICESE
jgi:hypothetical protein